MRRFNPENERIKRRYFDFLRHARQLSEGTVDQVAAALMDFEGSNGFRDFRLFKIEQAQRYKRKLSDCHSAGTGRPLAKATVSSRLAALKAFFQWLSQQPGFKSRLPYSDAEYFNPSAKDVRIAKAPNERPVPSLDQIRSVLDALPAGTGTELRNRALIAFTILSGARDDAIASMSLRHVDMAGRRIFQHPRDGVRTKNAKTITTAFFPVGNDVVAIVADWIEHLTVKLLWGPDDPLFPASKVELGDSGHFENAGLDRKHWKDAAAIRLLFKDAFARAGLPYYNPHSFRHALALLGERICPTPEAFKAWSQNLGHSHVLTTFTSYGSVSQHRQDEIFAELACSGGVPRSQSGPLVMVKAERLDRMEQMIARLEGYKAPG